MLTFYKRIEWAATRMTKNSIQDLMGFLECAPTSWHAVERMQTALERTKFTELDEKKTWQLKKGGGYFLRRGGSLIAFRMPLGSPKSARILAAHSDSPALKLKPSGEFVKDGLTLLNFEVYGAPILATWIDRDLYLAGRIFYSSGKNKVVTELVEYPDFPIFIAPLAIHLDRTVNDTGLVLNKQEHLSAIASVEHKKKSFLQHITGKKDLLHAELFAVPKEAPALFGLDQELLASYRLDNLVSAFAAISALLKAKSERDRIQLAAIWNHEEIGSKTSEGADSSFFKDTLARISLATDQTTEEFYCLKANSATISIDVSHGAHPNYSDKLDPRHKSILGGGICLKQNAGERYHTQGELAAEFALVMQQAKLNLQHFVSRNDLPSGSTIGPLHAAMTGMPSIDIGLPLLSMHAAREIIHVDDFLDLMKALELIYTN